MRKIGFIGTFDKTDFIIQVGKILTEMGKSVIVIDSTLNQKAKYVVPVINPTKTYITEFENIDVAVGFEDFAAIQQYLGLEDKEDLDYDIALFDIDSAKSFDGFGMRYADLNFFVTSFDLFSLKKGLEILSGINYDLYMMKILFSKEMSQEEDDYLNFLSQDYSIQWDNVKIYFPLEAGDQSVIMESQRAAKIKFRNLSGGYKEGLLLVAEQILGDSSIGELKRVMRAMEKGV